MMPSSSAEALIAGRRPPATFRFIDAIRINRLRQEEHDGRVYWVKQRRLSSRAVIPCANAFFTFAQNPVVVWASRHDWMRWEIDSFFLLHSAEGYTAFAGEDRSIWAEQLPGFALEALAKSGRIAPAMLAAAARELRRAHQLPCPALNGEGWSHGDAHLDNFIYDPATDRARLIDFEVAHRPGMPAPERHADDLFVMIQGTMGYWPLEQWLTHSRLVLTAYFDSTPADERQRLTRLLLDRLAPPTGISRVWWAIRTDYLPASERNARIAALRAELSAH